MNILFICNEFPPSSHGGIGTATQMLAIGLHERGHTVLVAGFYNDVSSSISIGNERGILVYRLKQCKQPLAIFRSRFRLYRLVKKILRTHSVNIVEVPEYLGLAAFWPRLPVPVVVRLHGSSTYLSVESGKKINKKYYFYERQTLRKATQIIAVSKSIAEKTRNIFRITSPIEIIYNSINIEATNNLKIESREPHKVVFTGTLMKIKGIFSLIEAWPQVVKNVPQARLHIFGKDSLNERGASIKSLLIDKLALELHQSVVFYGHVNRERIMKELLTASVTVLPSFTEAFALAPLESMAQGCPTIYTKCASGPEVIDDGVNGLLVDPANPDEIAQAIIRILTDGTFAAKIGNEGKKIVAQRFSARVILEQNERMYNHLITLNRKKPKLSY